MPAATLMQAKRIPCVRGPGDGTESSRRGRRSPKSENGARTLNQTTPAATESRAFSWQAVLDTYLPALVLALGVGIALPAIPTLARSFHVSFGLASGVITAFLIGNVLGTIPTGWLIDRFGRRQIMLVGPLLTSAMAFLVVVAHSFPELLVLRLVDGFAAQMWLIGRLSGISERAQPNQRGRQVNWMFSMDSTGRLTGPLAGGFIAASFGLRAPFVAYGFLALVALIPAFLFVQDTRPHRLEPSGAGVPHKRPSIRAIVLPRLVYFAVAFFANMARGPISADLFHLYAAYTYHLGPQQIGFLATGASSLSLPLGFLSGWMMDCFGRKKLLVPGFTGVTVTMILLALSAFLHLPLSWYVAFFLMTVACNGLTISDGAHDLLLVGQLLHVLSAKPRRPPASTASWHSPPACARRRVCPQALRPTARTSPRPSPS